MHIESPLNGISWIDFRYEKLRIFYFHCGIVGHINDHRKNLKLMFRGITAINQIDKRQILLSEILFSSNPLNKASINQYNSPTQAMSNQLA